MAVTGPISGVGPIRLRFLPGGPAGPIGLTGRGITSTAINGSGHLIITYTDASIVDAGLVVGPAGAVGPVGAAGRSITAVAVNPSNHLILTFNDGGTLDAGVVVGPTGPTGKGVQVAAINPAGHLIITYTDLTTTDAGQALGATGAAGRRAGLPLTWSSDNTNSNPGTAAIKVNNGTLGAATEIYVSDTDADGKGIAKLVGAAAESLGNKRGRIEISDVNLPSNFASFDVTGPAVLNGGWTTVPVVHRDHGGTIINGTPVLIFPVANGEKGDTGATGVQGNPGATGPAGTNGINGESPGMQWAFTPGTADSDPGNGNFRLNTPDPTTATLLYIDNVEFRAGTLATTWLDAIDDATNGTAKGQIAIAQVDNRANFIVYQVTGSVTDVTGYRHVPVLWLSGSPTLPTGPCVFQFSRSGDRGQDGAGGNMFGSVGTGLDGHIAIFDGDGFHVRDGGPEGVLAGLNTVNNNQWGPGAPLSVANGGTGGTTVPTAQAGLSLVPGTNVQAQNPNLQSLSAIGGAADTGTYFTGAGAMASYPLTTFGRAFGGLPNAASARTSLGLVLGTDVQPFDLELAAIASTVSGANLLPFFTGSGTAATTPFGAYGRTLVGSVDAAGARTNLGLGNVAVLNNTAMGPLSGITTLDASGAANLNGGIGIANTAPALTLNKAASGQTNILQGITNNVGRWALSLGDSTPESGSNAGSDFSLYRYADAGDFLGTAFTVSRSTAAATFASTITTSTKGNHFGTVGGNNYNGALVQADANIKLYDQGTGNWAGMGTDNGGNLWFRTGGSGTPPATLALTNDGQAVFRGAVSGITTLTTSGTAFFGSPISIVADPANALVLDIRGRSADDWSIIRFLDHNATAARGSIQCDSTGVMSISNAIGPGLTIDASTNALFYGNLGGIKTLATSQSAFFGANAGTIQVTAQGGNSANGDGANFGVFNGGVLTCAFGNKSCILGGVFTYQPFIYTNNAGLEIDSTLTIHTSLTVLGTNAGIELGTPSVVNTPFIDFHSSGTSNDCDVRIISSGGAATAGLGTLTIQSANVSVTQLLVAEGVNTYNGKVEVQSSRNNYGIFINNNGAAGATLYDINFAYLNTSVGVIYTTDVATAYVTSSDGNLKEDLRDFRSGPFFDRVRVYDFAWRANGSRGIGCVAQELYEIEPRAVVPGETRTMPATEDEPEREMKMPWGIDYSKLVPHLIAEVQALRARVACLEAGR
jgi:hypothetical protein